MHVLILQEKFEIKQVNFDGYIMRKTISNAYIGWNTLLTETIVMIKQSMMNAYLGRMLTVRPAVAGADSCYSFFSSFSCPAGS